MVMVGVDRPRGRDLGPSFTHKVQPGDEDRTYSSNGYAPGSQVSSESGTVALVVLVEAAGQVFEIKLEQRNTWIRRYP